MQLKLKHRFPVFKKNPNLIFFDTAASALKVDSMIEAVSQCYSYEYANIHRGIYDLSAKLTKQFEDSRLRVSKFINAPSSDNIIFTKINLFSIFLSFLFSYITIKFFLNYIKKFTLIAFVIYRIILGSVLLIVAYL